MEKQVDYIYVSMAYIWKTTLQDRLLFFICSLWKNWRKKKSLWNNNERKRSLLIKEGNSGYVIKE